MREILFRGQTRRKGEKVHAFTGKPIDGNWVYGGVMQGKGDFSIIYSYEPIEKNVVHTDTIGQFTGLTDENGKKIFEGDIMPVWENGEKYLYKVVYCGDCFMLAMLDSEQGSYPLSIKHNISEVIGNIHDNPELLEVQNGEE